MAGFKVSHARNDERLWDLEVKDVCILGVLIGWLPAQQQCHTRNEDWIQVNIVTKQQKDRQVNN